MMTDDLAKNRGLVTGDTRDAYTVATPSQATV